MNMHDANHKADIVNQANSHPPHQQRSVGKSCCMPATVATGTGADMPSVGKITTADKHVIPQVTIPKQVFLMGDANQDGYPFDGETPTHYVALDAFEMDSTVVSNAQFAEFVADTGYRTDAEKLGFSAVFHLSLDAHPQEVIGTAERSPWWLMVKNANWQQPSGSLSNIDALMDHPVVHISWNDAQAYCHWAQRALPTEAQWEAAARGGQQGWRYPWGNSLYADEDALQKHQCNIWQGTFPNLNTLDDGFLTTAPVHSYQANHYGLWQMIGNVWEWCQDSWGLNSYRQRAKQPLSLNPVAVHRSVSKVMRGGSFLCHQSYCNRYRNAARTHNTQDSSMANAGFRTVKNLV